MMLVRKCRYAGIAYPCSILYCCTLIQPHRLIDNN